MNRTGVEAESCVRVGHVGLLTHPVADGIVSPQLIPGLSGGILRGTLPVDSVAREILCEQRLQDNCTRLRPNIPPGYRL